MYPYFATIFPSIFHTAAIWLTVYLAAQRCIYICMPKLVRNHCTIKRSKQVNLYPKIADVYATVLGSCCYLYCVNLALCAGIIRHLQSNILR